MKTDNRTRFLVSKKMRNGIDDRFTVVVLKEEETNAKKGYESRGYKVSKVNL